MTGGSYSVVSRLAAPESTLLPYNSPELLAPGLEGVRPSNLHTTRMHGQAWRYRQLWTGSSKDRIDSNLFCILLWEDSLCVVSFFLQGEDASKISKCSHGPWLGSASCFSVPVSSPDVLVGSESPIHSVSPWLMLVVDSCLLQQFSFLTKFPVCYILLLLIDLVFNSFMYVYNVFWLLILSHPLMALPTLSIPT